VDRSIRPAIAIGAAAGLRTFTPPAALALAGRGIPARGAFGALALVELIADKHPAMTSRLRPEALAARALSAGFAGRALCGNLGAGVAILGAALSAPAGSRARATLGRRSTRPDWEWALLEDALAVVLCQLALRRTAAAIS